MKSKGQRPYKKDTKKGEYIKQKGRGTIYMALFTFTSVVQILDYVDKNHMNTHYFRCSDLNKLMIIIIIIIIMIIIIIVIILIMIITIIIIIIIIIKHHTSLSVASVNK